LSSFGRLGARAGVIGPLIFAGVFLVEGWLRPGYSPVAQFVSELSLGPRGFIQIANFIVFGILLSLFAIALRREFRSRRMSAVAPTLLIAIAVALFISGPCVMDPRTTLPAQYSAHGLAHALAGALVFTGWPVALVLMAVAVRHDAHWRPLRVPTILAALATVGALVAMTATKRPPGATPWAYAGLAQRAHILAWLSWTVIAAVRLASSAAKPIDDHAQGPP
jgi:hypothetical membrane protein